MSVSDPVDCLLGYTVTKFPLESLLRENRYRLRALDREVATLTRAIRSLKERPADRKDRPAVSRALKKVAERLQTLRKTLNDSWTRSHEYFLNIPESLSKAVVGRQDYMIVDEKEVNRELIEGLTGESMGVNQESMGVNQELTGVNRGSIGYEAEIMEADRRLINEEEQDGTGNYGDEKRNRERLRILITDHLLRHGHTKSASLLAPGTDTELFLARRDVAASISLQSTDAALSWCSWNSSRLRSVHSSLEFHLRVQDFVELVRQEDIPAALQYARSHFPSYASTHLEEIRTTMGLLAGVNTYLLDEDRWNVLLHEFDTDYCRVLAIGRRSLLDELVRCGLSALSTPLCGKPNGTKQDCPVCCSVLSGLAAKLPHPRRTHSCLVCPWSGESLSGDNRPVVLPNGNMYGWKTVVLPAMTKSLNAVTDPRTKESFPMNSVRKMFVA